jgi:hypothetical protein
MGDREEVVISQSRSSALVFLFGSVALFGAGGALALRDWAGLADQRR